MPRDCIARCYCGRGCAQATFRNSGPRGGLLLAGGHRLLGMTDLGSGDARIRELMRELSELRDRHEAVARVFQDLARSQMRLQPILDQIAEAMTSLLRAEYSLIHLTEGELLHFRAYDGVPAAAVEYERLHPAEPGGVETLTGRVALTKQPVHIPDLAADADYNFP